MPIADREQACGEQGGRFLICVHVEVLTFEERNHIDQTLVAGSAIPFRNDDRVFRLKRRVIRVGVEQNDLGEVSVQVRQILTSTTEPRCQSGVQLISSRINGDTNLDDLAFDVPCTFPEKLVRKVCLERIELVGNGKCGL
jgi:hypothetical protein